MHFRGRPGAGRGRAVVRQQPQENLLNANPDPAQEKEDGHLAQKVSHTDTVSIAEEEAVANQRGITVTKSECVSEKETSLRNERRITLANPQRFAAP